eukprot:1671683-Prorocentrum_lima.AAC.1
MAKFVAIGSIGLVCLRLHILWGPWPFLCLVWLATLATACERDQAVPIISLDARAKQFVDKLYLDAGIVETTQ